jgi:heat shock protein HslJ
MPAKATLSGTAWWVEDIAGKGVIDSSHTTIQFTEDGRVAGSTGCNRYFGSAEIEGSDVSFGSLAGTRKMCAAALMDQETKFFQAMENVTSWEIAETGLLYLRGADGNNLLRASQTDDP